MLQYTHTLFYNIKKERKKAKTGLIFLCKIASERELVSNFNFNWDSGTRNFFSFRYRSKKKIRVGLQINNHPLYLSTCFIFIYYLLLFLFFCFWQDERLSNDFTREQIQYNCDCKRSTADLCYGAALVLRLSSTVLKSISFSECLRVYVSFAT